jgi:hypothetical protein
MPPDRSTVRNKTNKDNSAEKTKERWRWRRMHGQLPHNLDEKLMDIEQSH